MRCPYCHSENVHNAENHWSIKPYKEIHKDYQKHYIKPNKPQSVNYQDVITLLAITLILFNVIIAFTTTILITMITIWLVDLHHKKYTKLLDIWLHKKVCEDCNKVFKSVNYEPVALGGK